MNILESVNDKIIQVIEDASKMLIEKILDGSLSEIEEEEILIPLLAQYVNALYDNVDKLSNTEQYFEALEKWYEVELILRHELDYHKDKNGNLVKGDPDRHKIYAEPWCC